MSKRPTDPRPPSRPTPLSREQLALMTGGDGESQRWYAGYVRVPPA